MALIDWDDSFSVGEAAMDADHKALIEAINRLAEAWAEGGDGMTLAALFDDMVARAEQHFAREERLLAAKGYARLDAQHAQHVLLRGTARDFRERHLAGHAPPPLDEDMAYFLRTWLLAHVLDEDMAYKSLFA